MGAPIQNFQRPDSGLSSGADGRPFDATGKRREPPKAEFSTCLARQSPDFADLGPVCQKTVTSSALGVEVLGTTPYIALTPRRGAVFDAGWSSPVARQAHNLKVAGSNPAPATKKPQLSQVLSWGFPFKHRYGEISCPCGVRNYLEEKVNLGAPTRRQNWAGERTCSCETPRLKSGHGLSSTRFRCFSDNHIVPSNIKRTQPLISRCRRYSRPFGTAPAVRRDWVPVLPRACWAWCTRSKHEDRLRRQKADRYSLHLQWRWSWRRA